MVEQRRGFGTERERVLGDLRARSAEGLAGDHETQQRRLDDARDQEDRREEGVDELRQDVARPLAAPRCIRPELKGRAVAIQARDYRPINRARMAWAEYGRHDSSSFVWISRRQDSPGSLCGTGERLVLLRHEAPQTGFCLDQLNADAVLPSVAAEGALKSAIAADLHIHNGISCERYFDR